MASNDQHTPAGEASSSSSSLSSSSSASSSHSWKESVFIPTLLAGLVGAGTGLVSKHRKVHGLARISATYATNFAIITGCYCGARELVRVTRKTGPDDLLNSAIAGFGSGALLGHLQGGQRGAVRYSIIFAVAGTVADFATLKLNSVLRDYNESIYGDNKNSENKGRWFKLPEWSPIRVLDDEASAEKQAQEQQLLAQKERLRELSKEES
ncbi:Mitochondrial import inner membrane translocase subunit Tim17/Tim22/Tim23 family protein [Quillaja saponaria]|uniref:Mitochondrial import inner membrane translocase subunit Tim17/Tim22/Tim23 family protein n=1 Tax=Quillaja saponaria TaxID=32244 RepID=A0AAD7LNT5_QUISA|nr:Mitochondrial import inner membrane translocase subunit Tim17/Tim22/Tim23 family protein [Quillaja saponaria]